MRVRVVATESLTDLLNAAQGGDDDAAARAYAAVYSDLRDRARQALRRAPGATLTPTALVHELYVRLDANSRGPLHDRQHFLALASRAMRQIIIEHARRRHARKRGGDQVEADLDAAFVLADADLGSLLEIDQALCALEQHDGALAQLVEWHFFAGLSFSEIADATRRHERTVRRDWEFARAFLRRELGATAS